ncbi:hypothetical protein Tco_0181320, partial [Tanacetum coccineum]
LELTRGRVVLLTGVNDQGDANIQDVGHNVVNKEGAADGQENPVNAGIVRIEDEVPATVAEKAKESTKNSTGEKSVAVLQSLLEGSTLVVEVGVTAASTVPFLTSSVTLMPEREGGGLLIPLLVPIYGPNVQSPISDPPIMTTPIATMVVVDTSSVPVPRAGYEPVHHTLFSDST